ncbi:glycosyltransferase family protein [Rhizohabitans arisaemae]|uniref:glycosyltransferase family protein n=1 Tax=Rhizohabitans arisaemae TaxID=2720610 RepID=UPI0024B05C37|nr:glycosyltransferase [Rhizohabitans arisaemae]
MADPNEQWLSEANQMSQESKRVERYEAQIKELTKQLAQETARADYVTWQLESTKARRMFRLAEAAGTAKRPKGLVRLPRTLAGALKRKPAPARPQTKSAAAAARRAVAPTVIIPEVEWPAGPIVRPGLRVAVILDAFSKMAFRYEWEQIEFGVKDWREVLEREQPEILFVESAWWGNDGRWQYQMTGTNAPKQELRDLIAYCKERLIPTVFWNKEDPPNFDKFIDTAKLFDFVFTCDGDCVPKYKEILGHDRVDVLQFAAQPRVHNPVSIGEGRIHDVVFAGMYFRDKHPERREQMDTILEPIRELGLHIFARNDKAGEQYAYPEQYRPHIVGELPYEQMLAAYKMYKVFLNVNSVIDSPTMCARRVFELSACSTTVLSGHSKAIEQTFGDLIPIARDPEEAYNHALYLINSPELRARQGQLALREVFTKHTFSHRVDQVLTTLGRFVEPRTRSVSAVLPTNRETHIEHAISQVARQRLQPQLVIVLHGLDLAPETVADKARAAGVENVVVLPADKTLSLGACLNLGISRTDGDLVTKWDDDNLYGEHYLSDMIFAFQYSDAEMVGKGAHYTYFEGNGATVLRFPDFEHRYTHLLNGGTFLAKRDLFLATPFEDVTKGEDTRLVRRLKADGVRIYSTDRFNFVYMRAADRAAHTWQADEHKLTRNGRFSFIGRPENHVMI